MTFPVNQEVIDVLLLGQGDRQRQLQSLPIRGDVWGEIAAAPGAMHDLLITPHHDFSAARVARILAKLTDGAPTGEGARRMSYLTAIVAARLSLEDIWSVLIPMTSWWADLVDLIADDWPTDNYAGCIRQELSGLALRERLAGLDAAGRAELQEIEQRQDRLRNPERQLVRLGLLLGVLRASAAMRNADQDQPENGSRSPGDAERLPFSALIDGNLPSSFSKQGADALRDAHNNYGFIKGREEKEDKPIRGCVWSVSSNRRVEFAASRSVPAIKADAARQLFSISCKGINWAILDSGIDSTHPAFDDLSTPEPPQGVRRPTRVSATYDFGNIRDILNSGNSFDIQARAALVDTLATATGGDATRIDDALVKLAEAIGDERAVDWSVVEPLVRRNQPTIPQHPHGTHVAGILGGHWVHIGTDGVQRVKHVGVCPDIGLYDFRVLGPDTEQTEFAVIAALQFIGYLNRRNAYPAIDGINMSLSIPHNVRNYACGYTPVCVEAEARVAQGTVVVAAAGNRGYQQYRLADGSQFASYAASSITDPGNAEGVITVGATHRYWPHTYGVSFFSSRGPTGDGRVKPDLVAPGERIESVVPGPDVDAQDGTSMATPHVSGAAALIMARHRELRGRPAYIKKVLCDSATDLGRDRSFQGHGMVDVLRAIQAI